MHASDLQHYAAPAVLRDGGLILIRAIAASDKQLLRELFSRLSPDSIRHRVFGAKSELTEKELVYLTELDFERHVALAAILRERGEERIVGVGRYIRIPPPRRDAAAAAAVSTRAEVAFTVVDEHQGRGVGAVLLEHLAHMAHAEGIDELDADVMADNAQMMQVFADSGFAVRKSMDDGVYHVLFPTSETQSFIRASIDRHAAAECARNEKSARVLCS